jgi:hypothetical protein
MVLYGMQKKEINIAKEISRLSKSRLRTIRKQTLRKKASPSQN